MKPVLAAKYALGATCLLCFAGIMALSLLPSTETAGLLLICGGVVFITGLLLTIFSRRGTGGRILVLIGTSWMTTATIEPGPINLGLVIAATALAVLLAWQAPHKRLQ